jgi:hypothetical protein
MPFSRLLFNIHSYTIVTIAVCVLPVMDFDVANSVIITIVIMIGDDYYYYFDIVKVSHTF